MEAKWYSAVFSTYCPIKFSPPIHHWVRHLAVPSRILVICRGNRPRLFASTPTLISLNHFFLWNLWLSCKCHVNIRLLWRGTSCGLQTDREAYHWKDKTVNTSALKMEANYPYTSVKVYNAKRHHVPWHRNLTTQHPTYFDLLKPTGYVMYQQV